MAYAGKCFDNSLTAADVEDIKIMYRDCKYKRHQIHILAEMYLVSQETIVQVLGLDVLPGGRGYRRGTKKQGGASCKKSTSP